MDFDEKRIYSCFWWNLLCYWKLLSGEKSCDYWETMRFYHIGKNDTQKSKLAQNVLVFIASSICNLNVRERQGKKMAHLLGLISYTCSVVQWMKKIQKIILMCTPIYKKEWKRVSTFDMYVLTRILGTNRNTPQKNAVVLCTHMRHFTPKKHHSRVFSIEC